MAASVDYYSVLGILPSADIETVKAVYRVLAKKFHPDVNGSNSTEFFRNIHEAYETLSDPAKRAAYDRRRESSQEGGQFDEASEASDEDTVRKHEWDEDWSAAQSVYPEIERHRLRLEAISPKLALSFQLTLLSNKEFGRAVTYGEALEAEYFSTYFGTSRKVHDLAKFLLHQKRRDLAKKLNRIVKVVGSPGDGSVVVSSFIADHGIYPEYYENGVGYSFTKSAPPVVPQQPAESEVGPMLWPLALVVAGAVVLLFSIGS